LSAAVDRRLIAFGRTVAAAIRGERKCQILNGDSAPLVGPLKANESIATHNEQTQNTFANAEEHPTLASRRRR
jgi:hypothetical protein